MAPKRRRISRKKSTSSDDDYIDFDNSKRHSQPTQDSISIHPDVDSDHEDAVRNESEFEKMPLVILNRVSIQFLSIYDLSKLSTTCSKLASKLTDGGIWDAVISANLPWVKEVGGLSKLQAMQLVLRSDCQSCGRILGVHIYWFWNRRECFRCLTEVTISRTSLAQQYKLRPIAFEHLFSIPYNARRARGTNDKGERYLLSQVNSAQAEYERAAKEGLGDWLMECTLTKHKRSLETKIACEMEKAAKAYLSEQRLAKLTERGIISNMSQKNES